MTTAYLIHHQPPTTNHNLLIAGWKKHVWKNRHFLRLTPRHTSDGISLKTARRQAIHGLRCTWWRKPVLKVGWFLLAIRTPETFLFVKKIAFAEVFFWHVPVPDDSSRDPTRFPQLEVTIPTFEFGSWNFTLPQKGHGLAELAGLFGLFLLQTFYQSLSSVVAKGFFLQQLCHHTRFFPGEYTPRRRKNHSCTQPGRNNGATTGAPCWTSSGHIEKCWENPFFGWHPDKNPTPYNIYTFSTGHWVYMYSLLKGLQQEGLNS